jgi:hypothetical protein
MRCRLGIFTGQPTIVGRQPGSSRIAQILRRHRWLRTPGPFYCYRVSRVSEVDAIRTPAPALSQCRHDPARRSRSRGGAAHGASMRPCRARFTYSGKRAGGAPAALARSTRTPYRLTLEGEQSAHQRSANPNQRGPRQLHRRERRFPARRQRERDAPCAATHSANNKRRFARCARRDGMHGRATCD